MVSEVAKQIRIDKNIKSKTTFIIQTVIKIKVGDGEYIESSNGLYNGHISMTVC